MSKRDSSAMAGGIIGFIAGSATSAGETASLNLTSEQFFTGDGLDDTSSEVSHLADSSTDIADGNTALLTTILGSISGVAGSSGGSLLLFKNSFCSLFYF